MKKTVCFFQANMSYGESKYLPYAAGCLIAYAKAQKDICDEYDFADIVFTRENPAAALRKVSEPFLAAFSCYTWNFEYHKVLAEMLKERFAECIVVFGGHNIPYDDSLLYELPYVDILMHGEGEESFSALLNAFSRGETLRDVPGISYRADKNQTKTNASVRPGHIDKYPSPYLSGVFDGILKRNPDVRFSAISETNRGCPYGCSYCDWSLCREMQVFPIERVKKELQWFADHKIEYVFCADSNFGMLERDFEISEYIVRLRKHTGYPRVFGINSAKYCNDNVFRIIKILFENRISKGVTLSHQTLNSEALANINRRNFSLEEFTQILRRYNACGIPAYADMIIGLPGETYDSFCDGLCKLLECGMNMSMSIYDCQVYCNAQMGQEEYRRKFGIKTMTLPLNFNHARTPREGDVQEYVDVIRETASMPEKDMRRAHIFKTALQCFHFKGWLKFFAAYMYQSRGVSYRQFYDAAVDFVFSAQGTLINSLFMDYAVGLEKNDGSVLTYSNPDFGPVGWYPEEGIALVLAQNKERFYREAEPFLSSLGIEPELYRELLAYQKSVIRTPEHREVEISSSYGFYDYFLAVLSGDTDVMLKRARNTVRVRIDNPVNNWQDYAREVVLYSNRRNDMIITNCKEAVTVEYY